MKNKKFLYLTLFILISITAVGQIIKHQKKQKPISPMEEYFNLRKKMMMEMMGDHEWAMKHFESLLNESRSDFSHFNFDNVNVNNAFEGDWSESKDGRTLSIRPKSKKSKINIKVEQGMVMIESQENDDHFSSTSIHQQSVPEDCDLSKVKIDEKGGKITLFFPYLNSQIKHESKSEERSVPEELKSREVDI